MVSSERHLHLGRERKERGESCVSQVRFGNGFNQRKQGALNKPRSARRKWATKVFPAHHAGPQMFKVSESVTRSWAWSVSDLVRSVVSPLQYNFEQSKVQIALRFASTRTKVGDKFPLLCISVCKELHISRVLTVVKWTLQSRAAKYCWPSPAQSSLLLCPHGNTWQFFFACPDVHVFRNGASSSTRGEARLELVTFRPLLQAGKSRVPDEVFEFVQFA
jgi:phage-related protein